ncbi:epimerase [Marinibactrum halimedae]|uniref:Epimerase n=2 Tax=Marinibactrum halimedae TaxID=1444977 RepID=A0AA37WLU6_9GAMM|nr:epimerase [Marinibactrum halimedae]
MTGASGLIAQHWLSMFGKEYEVTGLTRNVDSAKSHSVEPITWIESLDRYPNFDDFDVVLNLAGESLAAKRWSDTQKQEIRQSRWALTKILVSKIKASQRPPSVFISGSAVGIYGDHRSVVIDELSQPSGESFGQELCAQWESIALQAQEFTRVVLLRTGIVLSTKGGALAQMLPPFKFGMGGVMGNGEHYMPWIHIDDMARAIEFLLTKNLSGPVNVTSPEPMTNREFTQALASTLHRPAFFPMPALALRLLFGEMSQLLTLSQRVVPQRLSQEGFEFQYPSLSSAFQQLLNEAW